MRKLCEFTEQQLYIANQEYEELKAKARKSGNPHSVTINSICSKNKISPEKLKEWRYRNGYTRGAKLKQLSS